MAGGPSPSSTSPSNLSNSPFLHGSFSSSSSSPPKPPFAPQNTMTADVFSASHSYSLPAPIGERRGTGLDKNALSLLSFSEADPSPEPKAAPAAIFLRKLPSNSDRDAVRNILLFAKDLIDCEIVPTSTRYPEDKGFASAVARFKTLEGAKEARNLLNGKRTASNDASIIVELVQESSPGAIGSRRNTVDSTAARQGSVSAASGIGATTNGRQSSRFNGTFQSMEKMSPPNGTPGLGNGEFPVQNLFSPTSPVSTSFAHRNLDRNLGKSVINDEADDDDGLLKESIGYATAGPPVQPTIPRRTTNPSIPVSRFASLSLNTSNGNGMASPPIPSYASPRTAATMQSPGNALSAMSPHTIPSTMSNLGPNATYQQYTQHFSRHNYPPVNPADQNPPCNTLYVGNLPIDTSEDELKAIFSKQRGYKRLCFRTKQNGPMCFVEFEDISFATKALNELYGQLLHNSVKGGIRLSFSKNPLGVRTGQSTSMGPSSAITPTSAMSGFGSNNISAPPGFSTATGPPPGLAAPPGLSTPIHANGSSGFGMYSNGGFGMAANDMASPIRTQPLTTGLTTSVSGNGGFGGMSGGYPSYMMGR